MGVNIRRVLFAAVAIAAVPAPATAADVRIGDIVIEQPYSRETPKTAPVGAGYLTIRNAGQTPDRLIGIECACAASSEVHQMANDAGVLRMGAVEGGLVVPANGSVTLAPGGYHLMFMGLAAPFVAGQPIAATLTFEQAGVVLVEFEVRSLRRKRSKHR